MTDVEIYEDNILYLQPDNILDVLNKTKQPIVASCYAEWCPDCQEMKPIFEKVATEYNGRCVFTKVLVDEEPELVDMLQIRAIPTLFLINSGITLGKIVGSLSLYQLRCVITNFLNVVYPEQATLHYPSTNRVIPEMHLIEVPSQI